jgi:2-hydroxy-3-keto-5-methylthiopentenyl-1-phosphate phosphatase
MKTTENNSETDNRYPCVLSDFDDTAAEQNVAELLLQRFGDTTWTDVRDKFRKEELNLKEYQEIVFRHIDADIDTMQNYVKEKANLRPHFGELVAHCASNNIPLAIVSQGLDFYIEALLKSEGYDSIPVYAVNTSFDSSGITYHYNHTCPGKESQGNSKSLIVNNYQGKGYKVYYMGDGRSDFEAAKEADVVFAHSILAEECDKQGISYIRFNDFGDVLKRLIEQ